MQTGQSRSRPRLDGAMAQSGSLLVIQSPILESLVNMKNGIASENKVLGLTAFET